VKIGPVDANIFSVDLKKKKFRKVKYIARLASLPSRLNKFLRCFYDSVCFQQQEAFEKCWAHSPLRAAARRLFYIAIHQVSLLSHAACASMSTTTTTTTTTTTRDRGERYGP